MNGNKGYSLVELIVTMAIFIVILGLGSYAFQNIIATSAQQSKSIQSNIEGMIGLEVMRQDIQHAGFGLPWAFQNYTGTLGPAFNYKECDVVTGWQAKGVDSTSFNDTPPDMPRALSSGTSTKEVNGADAVSAGGGPDYLVVKSSIAAINNTAKKWSYVNYSTLNNITNKSYIRSWGKSDDIANDDRVVTINSTFTAAGKESKLLVTDGKSFSYKVNGFQPPSIFQPGDGAQVYIVYGIDGTKDLKMPYNRADFYVKKPSDNFPAACNQNTGTLYKAVAQHGGAGFTEYPLLDCVGDMQVEFELTDPETLTQTMSLPAGEIRERLREVRVYLLVQEGRKDTGFKFPIADVNNVIQVGDKRLSSSGRRWTSANMQTVFGADWRNYRWKVYTIVVNPSTLK